MDSSLRTRLLRLGGIFDYVCRYDGELQVWGETRRDRTILPHRGWSVRGPYQWFFVSANGFEVSLIIFGVYFEDCLVVLLQVERVLHIYAYVESYVFIKSNNIHR